jgi:hypothetical protein
MYCPRHWRGLFMRWQNSVPWAPLFSILLANIGSSIGIFGHERAADQQQSRRDRSARQRDQ